jgi:hypothetical protein
MGDGHRMERGRLRNVGSEDERELEDRWWLGLRDRTVVSVDAYEFSVCVAFGDSSALTIESPAAFTSGPDAPATPALTVRPNETVILSEGLLSLVGQRVRSGVGFKTGSIRIVFDSGAHLLVPFDEHYEAWQLIGPSGRTWISMPGGGLITIPAESA